MALLENWHEIAYDTTDQKAMQQVWEKYFKEEKYLIYAENALDCVINHYQKEDGRIETFIEWNNEYEDYSSVFKNI